MAPSRFRRDRARDVTPFRDSAPAANAANAPTGPNRPTTPGPNSQPPRPTNPGPTNQPNRPTTPGPTSHPNRPTTPGPTNQPNSPCSESRSTTPSPVSRPMTPGPTSPVCVTPSPEKHPIWTSYDAPINFTWVIPEELCGMGWPKSRDQVRFLITQGIDHLVTLSPEKIPPVYAFPDLKHTSIPVEDFTGPTIAEIQKFIEIMDEARKDGEAVGVHCAEGRGRTGVMCACYLIYYHDMEPWDAIRIMRRQRPGSVERKIQEETVIKFWTLVQDYGKSSLDKLEEREKQLMEQQRRHQSELHRESDLVSQQMTMNLLGHMSSFYKQGPKVKAERCQRMRRAKSMTKIEDEEEKSIAQLKNHLASFFTGSGREGRQKRSKSQARDMKDSDGEAERRSRATTPGKGLIEEVKLKPVGESKPKNRLDPPPTAEEPCEYKNHFRDFMRTPAMNPRTPSTVKRGRSFSQPRDKDKDSGKEESLSRKESFEDKYVADRNEQENPLEKHSKRNPGQSLNSESPEPEIDPKVIFKPLKPSHVKQWEAEKKTPQQVINNNPSNSCKKLDETNNRLEVPVSKHALKAAAKQTPSQITNTFLPGNTNWKPSTRAESPPQQRLFAKTLAEPEGIISQRPNSLSCLNLGSSSYTNAESHSPITDSDRDSGIASATSLSAASIPQLLLEEANAADDICRQNQRNDSDFSDASDISDQEDKTSPNNNEKKLTCRTRRRQSRSPEKSLVSHSDGDGRQSRCQSRMWKSFNDNDNQIGNTPPKFNGVEIRYFDQTKQILTNESKTDFDCESAKNHDNVRCPFQRKVWHRRVGKYTVRKTFPEDEKPRTFQEKKQGDIVAGSRSSKNQMIDHENATDIDLVTQDIRDEIEDHDDNKVKDEIIDHVKAREIVSASRNIKEEIAKMRAEVAQMRAEVTDIGDHESDSGEEDESFEDSWENYSYSSMSARRKRSGTETSDVESEWSYSCTDEESLSGDTEQS